MTTSDLSYEVFVVDGPVRAGDQRMPDGSRINWNPTASTLIFGAEEALLVDPPFTHEQIAKVGDWIARSGKRLTYIYATHGHGDHWFGAGELVKRFPGAVTYATPGTIEVMHQQATVGRSQLFDVVFPGLIPESPVIAVPVPTEGFLLEGNLIQAVETGHTDTDQTTVLHVPSIGLVVAGDVVYNGVHQYIVETVDGGLREWLKALDRVEALAPRAVVAGHKNRDRSDDPACIDQTRQYLLNVERLLAEKSTAREFYDEMVRLYPDWVNPGPAWYGALALLGK
ncbi:MBL fold metallo-hydrolase [Micromonospora arborensis]|uniref:MBL fold metallo-hydrolase n=1 Tax=Micromonospora arborensis TaxID=2116518 RepID=A0A318NI88_9ACTN|nr:MBL fold metallo-hydrolase [Micromonospora arborensis]PYC69336.1 MBL fold metallo-hydrolase [Micromonospora arborensis]